MPRWLKNGALVDAVYTVDNVLIEDVVKGELIPMVNRYNELTGLDYRGLLCENADETVVEYRIPHTNMMRSLGPHSTPYYMGENRGVYQEFTDAYGEAVGFDVEFQKYAKANDYIDKIAEAIKRDQNRIRYEIIKEALNPQSAGRGFWNGTFDANSGITAPPSYGVNSFSSSHTHYNTTGAATIANLDFIMDGMHHIIEHGEVNGDFLVITNSATVLQILKLTSWIGTNRANISNPVTEKASQLGMWGSFSPILGATLRADDYVPANYVIILGGITSQKPFKFHEPNNPQFRGLRWLPGKNPNRPWEDSYVRREFRVRTFRRWQGCVYQVTSNATYTAPSEYA